jgi:Tfp pilus assembly protein PilO
MTNITSIVLILVSVGIFFGFIDPQYATILETKKNQESLNLTLKNAVNLDSQYQEKITAFDAISDEYKEKIEKMLPSSIDNIRLIIDLDEGVAWKNYHMRVRNFKAETTAARNSIGVDRKAYGTLSMSFSTTGSYVAFIAFLGSLEKSLRLIDVTGIQFAANDAGLYDFSVTARTYWLK